MKNGGANNYQSCLYTQGVTYFFNFSVLLKKIKEIMYYQCLSTVVTGIGHLLSGSIY